MRPSDLRKLTFEQMEKLSPRNQVISAGNCILYWASVPNLGVVELTIALHYVLIPLGISSDVVVDVRAPELCSIKS